MENRAHALAAGIFVALLSLLVLGLASFLTRETGVRDIYEISTRETVTGLQEQAPVRFRGVDVGKVKKIGFDPKSPGSVLVRMSIDRDTPLTKDTFATLSYQGVTGLAFIQLSDHGTPAPRLVPNDEAPPRIPLQPGLIAQLEDSGQVILKKVELTADLLNQLLGQDNQKRIATALDNLGGAAGSVGELAKNLDSTVKQRLDPALAQASDTLHGVQGAADQIGRTAAEFRQTAQRLNAKGGPIEQLSSGTGALSTAAETFSATTLPRINRATDETTRTVRVLHRAINELRENPQELIYGEGTPRPGPGEPGFHAPGGH